MTWYWWSHWFWITVIAVTLTTFPIISTETYPMNPPYGNKEYDKDKPLEFPLAAQTDDQSTFMGGDEMLTTAIRESRYLRNNKESDRNSNTPLGHDESSVKHSQITNVSSNELLSGKRESYSNESETLAKAHRTKAVDVSLDNNSSYVNDSNSSTISIKDTSKPLSISTEITHLSTISTDTVTDEEQAANVTDTHPDANQTDVNDFDSNESSLSASSEESLQNQTLPLSQDSSHSPSMPLQSSSSSSSSLSSSPSAPSSSSISKSSSSNIELFIDETSTYKKSFSLENITKEEEFIRAEIEKQLDGERGRKSKVLAEYRQELKFINFSTNTKNLLARSAAVSLEDLIEQDDDDKVSSEALSIQRAYVLDAGAISGICFAVLSTFCGVLIAGVALYRRRYLNKPQTLSEPDSSGYIDDSTIRDNSDEMYSLDNDSFLNSLEAMTIQNYWTDTVKHTKL